MIHLKPNKKRVEPFKVDGLLMWRIILVDDGIGLPIGIGKGFTPMASVYPKGESSALFPGGVVTASQSIELAKMAAWTAYVQEGRAENYAALDEGTKEIADSAIKRRRTEKPWPQAKVDYYLRLSDWFFASGGFRVCSGGPSI